MKFDAISSLVLPTDIEASPLHRIAPVIPPKLDPVGLDEFAPELRSIKMIRVVRESEQRYSVQLDEDMQDKLSDVSGWATPEEALKAIIADALLEWPFPFGYYGDPYGDVPF